MPKSPFEAVDASLRASEELVMRLAVAQRELQHQLAASRELVARSYRVLQEYEAAARAGRPVSRL